MYIYGTHAVYQFLETHPDRVVQLFMLKNQHDEALFDICEANNIPVSKVPENRLDEYSQQGNHQGVVLHVKPAQLGDERSLKEFCADLPDNPVFLVLDSIQDPHNLGACLRSAAAFGVTGVIWAKDKQAQITPVVRKVASGGVDLLNCYVVTNLGRALQILQEAGVWVVGTVLDEGAKPLCDIDCTGAIALVMGNEGDGLRYSTQKHCDFLGYIPLYGAVQSLNVSVATGIALYEVVRQR